MGAGHQKAVALSSMIEACGLGNELGNSNDDESSEPELEFEKTRHRKKAGVPALMESPANQNADGQYDTEINFRRA